MSDITIGIKWGDKTRNVRVSCIKRLNGWALHRTRRARYSKTPVDALGFSVTHIKDGKCILHSLHRADADALLRRCAAEHPNPMPTAEMNRRYQLSAAIIKWYRWASFWKYGGYKPLPLPRRRLLVLKRKASPRAGMRGTSNG